MRRVAERKKQEAETTLAGNGEKAQRKTRQRRSGERNEKKKMRREREGIRRTVQNKVAEESQR